MYQQGASKRFIARIMIMVVFIFLTGCQQPAKRPETDRAKLKQEPTISLYINETGETENIKLEKYLEGVVAAEMDPVWPMEALAAQAILARTFTMKKIEEGGVKARGTDASTSVEEFQAYDPTRVNDQVSQAVKRTRGEVLTYQGKYINSWFFADGGGRTAASAVEGLAFDREPTPYIKSVEDPGQQITVQENRSWTAVFPLEEVRQAVQQINGQDPGSITSARILEKGPSGRATKLQVGNASIGAPALRLALGSEKMRSTMLTSFGTANGQLTMQGKGFGHGVGMSQWGARALAEQGKKAEEIVQYFFKDTKIEKAWE